MDFMTFQSIVQKTKEKQPVLFALEYDEIPKYIEEISEFEKQNEIYLSAKYIQFLLHYGGGYFGYANIYSLDQNSDFYILHYNKKGHNPILLISDNGCGDFYGFQRKIQTIV